MNTCETCRFYLPVLKAPPVTMVNECRRNAPVPIAFCSESSHLESGVGSQTWHTVAGFWPTTDGLGCGEYEPKEKSDG